MAAVVKWKMIAALCFVLIIASQIATMWPLDRYLVSAQHSLQDQSDLPEPAHRFTRTKSHNGAPFIQHTSNNLSSFNRNLRWQQLDHQMQAEGFSEKGFSGPFSLLGDEEIELLPGIIRDWNRLRAIEHEMLVRDGFEAPAERTCFLWLEDCVQLGRHQPILKVVEGILGQPVLLFGLSVWSAAPNSRRELSINLEGFQCPTVDVVVNSGVRMFRSSHRMTKRMVLKLASQLKNAHKFYGRSQALQQRVQSVAFAQLNARVPGVDMVDIDTGDGKAYVIHGRLLYALSNPTDSPRTSMLLQYVPANCSLRDQQPDGSQLGYQTRALVPPTLRASVDVVRSSGNDVRDGFAEDEVLKFTESVDNKQYRLLAALPESRITIFRRQLTEIRSPIVPDGFYARSSLLSRITIEKTAAQAAEVAFKSYAENQLVVVVSGCLTHHHARKGYREVRELRTGGLTYLSSSKVHALVAAAANTQYISIRWSGNALRLADNRGVRSFNDGRQVFEMPVGHLGAINAKTIILQSGQAYDPENEADCDVLVVVVKGNHLQIIPFLEYVEASEAVFIPAGEACILWNAGRMPVTIVALQLYRSLKKSIVDDRDSSLLEAAYRTRGKVM